MKLSKAQIKYLKEERARMAQRHSDLESFGDDIYKNAKLSAEKSRINFRRWWFDMLIELHNVEVDAERAAKNENSVVDNPS